MENSYFKYCIVPLCTNTTHRTPNKIFIRVPEGNRQKWLEACKRNGIGDISPKNTNILVCEDHFNIEDDMENYIRFKLMGGRKKMKPDIVPHIFNWQPNRKRSLSVSPTAAAVKRIKKEIVDEAIASTSTIIAQSDSASGNFKSIPKPQPLLTDLDFEPCNTSSDILPQKSLLTKNNVSVQAHTVKVRSKAMQCKLYLGDSEILSPIKVLESKEITQKQQVNLLRNIRNSSSSEKNSENCNSENDSDFSAIPSKVSEELSVGKRNQFKNMCLNSTIIKLQIRPMVYTGIPDYAYYFSLLEKYCKLDSMHIFLTLKKIRTGNSFLCLADDFGISEGNASKIFFKSLPIISKYVRKFIIKPQIFSVKSNLPLAFQARYSKVFCIIDCFEVEIEKPLNASKQTLTWSEYKKCNTLKYLLSYTPDGIINFISGAFGGGASDAVIVEHSGFLNTLPSNVSVMADRGFKHIEHLLVVKGCVLVRTPTVFAGTKLTKGVILETKRIANLRIHVERVIRRLREFSFLAPHACIDNKLLQYTDKVVKIVCGLINLQSRVGYYNVEY